MAPTKQILILIFISAHVIFATCKDANSATSRALAMGLTKPNDEKAEPKDKEDKDKKDDDKDDDEKEKNGKKTNGKEDDDKENKGEEKNGKKANGKEDDDKENKTKEKNGKKANEKEDDDKENKGEEKNGKKTNGKEDDDKENKGEEKNGKTANGKEDGTTNTVANKMRKIEKKITEFNASLKERIENPNTSHGSHECVSECDEVLSAAIDDIKKTLDSIYQQNLVKANFDVSAVSTNVDTCNDCFDEMVGGDPEVKELSDWVQKTTGDVLEALEKAES